MSQLLTIRFNRHDAQPWGFRLQGGVDFGTPLVVQKVAGGSIADRAGLNAGDAIIKVNSTDVYNLRHKDAQDVIVRAGNTFDFTVQRGGGTWRPHVTPTGALPNPAPQYNYPNVNTVTKTSLAHKQPESRPIGTGYNNSARPFAPQNGGPVKSIVNKQYNTPVGMYSDESIAETLSAQAEVLANGVLGVNFKKNEKIYNAANSEVLKALHEAENDPVEPAPDSFYWAKSHAIGHKSPGIESLSVGQQQQTAETEACDRGETPITQNYLAPGEMHRPSIPCPRRQDDMDETSNCPKLKKGNCEQKLSQCNECGVGIVGVFVRIKDKNLHAECFRCATCGTSLKNQGYFNVNNKLYCDLHAKLAAMSNPPTGTDGYLPVPVKPGTKMSANTISAALTAHHPGSNGNLPSPSLNQPMNNNTPSYGPPKPYGYQAEPPSAGPRSPATYNAPSWIQPKPSGVNNFSPNYNTMPRSNVPQPTAGTANESTPIDTPETTELRPKKSKNKKSFVSGLHKPERIPKYQRNWTVLKSQTPIKSPIPPELEENIPLAFVEVPKHNTGEDLPNPPAPPERIHEYTQQSNTSYAANNQISSSTIIRNYIEDENESMKSVSTRHSMQQTKIIPKLIEPDAPSMSRSPPGSHYEEPIRRVTTPSLIKHAPTLPYYQQNLIFEAYGPTKAREFIRSRTPSPCLDRARSPAPGPPPNLLSVAAPHMQDLLSDTESVNYNQSSQYSVQAFNSNEISEEKSFVAYHSSNLKSYESTVQEQQYSNSMNDSLSNSSNIQHNLRNQENISRPSEGFKDCKRESIPYPHTTTMESPQFYNSIKNENPSYSSPTMTPATNYPTQFQPSRRESEMSIRSEPKPRKPSVTYEKRRPSATGFVQRQARRLSELDQQITDKSPDFPQINTPTPSSRFPVKSLFSTSEINSDVQAPFSYIISDKNKLKSPPKTQQSFMEQSFGSQKDSHDYEMKSTSTFKSTPQTAVDPIPLPVSHYNTVPVISTPVNDINTLTSFPPPPFTLTSNAAATASTSFSATSSHLVATKQEMTSTSISSLNNNEMPTQVISAFKAMHTNESYGFNKEPQLNSNPVSGPSNGSIGPNKGGTFVAKSAPRRGQGVLNKAIPPGGRVPLCGCCSSQIRGPFITALGRIWCPDHFICVNSSCRRPLQDIGFVEEKGDLYCEYCFEKYLAPCCSKCMGKIKGDCLNAIGKHYHPECFNCCYCGKLFGNSPFFLEEGQPYCEADWNELFTTKCFACGFPVEAGDRWVEALSHNYHSQCFNCSMCKKNLEGQSFFAKNGRPFCKAHAR